MFIPTTPEEVRKRGWNALDVILVTGDTYIDSSYNGTAIIGHWLIDNGFRVGIIAQPVSDEDVKRLGTPELFWSVSSGCVDSMVANYTALKKFRKDDDFTPGGKNDRRPDRACIVYTNMIRRNFKNAFVVLGGIEASLRRIAHYDYWSDSIRRSILFDSKADVITYGMAELSNLRLAQALRSGSEWRDIRGICYISKERKSGYEALPNFASCSEDDTFIHAFRAFYENNDPITAKGLMQSHGDRFLIQNPPSEHLDQSVLDRIYEMDFENRVHPFYSKQGTVRAMDTIKQSVTTHRGCYGECNFCAIAVHQGRTVISRSQDSVVREVEKMAKKRDFNGIIYDVGGPTANMYDIECAKKTAVGACKDRRCLFPGICGKLPIDHSSQIELLDRISDVEGVKKVFITSGVRYDMVNHDIHGNDYLKHMVNYNISGQMKIAPEHVSDEVLKAMGKPGRKELLKFKDSFDSLNASTGKKQFLTYYFMAAHPGCREGDMVELDRFVHQHLKTNPEQVQIFTPTPSTISSMMYRTRKDLNGKNMVSEHSAQMKKKQKDIVM